MSFELAGKTFNSRFFIGSSLYPSPQHMQDSVKASGSEIITVGLRRLNPQAGGGNAYWSMIQDTECQLLPNTAGCYTAEEAIATAQMAREIFGTDWIKLETLGDDYNLQPHPFELLKAAEVLVKDGFKVFAYTTDDLVLALKLYDLGVTAIMPWAAPIGTALGPINLYALEAIRKRLPDAFLVVDAGLGVPSHAAKVMELGYDACLLNSAVAQAADPVKMARAFAGAIEAGRLCYESGPIPSRPTAQASTPTLGTPFWHQG
ncbi:MAG: thiazole synthase [Proteobacteria bacterium]|nr:thiazole synthase [Pseudomonadota bacterium]